ncbi:MAG: Rrf2 family transcriptional regulator [Weeksellaceae bacterium]
MFSKTCEYAIRALIFIAQRTKDGSRVGIKQIAKEIDSPEYFIAKILQDLSRKGYVKSAKGPRGGFYLSEENGQRSLADIVRELDGDKLFRACALGLKECSENHPCPIHDQYKHIKSKWKHILETSLIINLAEKLDENLTFLNSKNESPYA